MAVAAVAECGRAAGGADVILYHGSAATITTYRAKGDDAGRYTVDRLRPGTYRAAVYFRPGGDRGAVRAANGAVDVDEGADSLRLDFELRDPRVDRPTG